MINEGDFFRYQKKALKVYKERMLHFEALLRHYFEDEIKFERPSNGFAFWIEFQESVSLTKLRQELKSRDVLDRKSTRLNSSHVRISYAVFCLKKKKKKKKIMYTME